MMSLLTSMSEVDLGRIKSWNQTAFVYVLLFNDAVVYVGRTVNLGQRLCFHAYGTERHEPKQFDRAFSIGVPIADAAAYEGALIRRFNPPLCSGAPTDESRDAEILARLGLDLHQANRDAFINRRRQLFVDAHSRRRVRRFADRRWRRHSLSSVLWKKTVRFLAQSENKAAS